MATLKQVSGTRTSYAFTTTTLSTLASATYVKGTSSYDCTPNQPQDVVIEVVLATTNAVAGNKQCLVFIQESLDGTNFRSGPTSGTTTTDEPDLKQLGVVHMNTSTTTHRELFSIASVLGFVPNSFFIVIKNDVGVALTSGTVFTSEISVVTA